MATRLRSRPKARLDPIELADAAFSAGHEQSPFETLILLYLILHRSEDDEGQETLHISVADLAAKVGASERSTYRALKNLQARRVIYQHKPGWGNTAAVWAVNEPKKWKD